MQSEFELRTEDEISCDCCGAFVPTIECQWLSYNHKNVAAYKYLCEFCFEYQGGETIDYDPDTIQAEIWRAVGAGVNFILDKISSGTRVQTKK